MSIADPSILHGGNRACCRLFVVSFLMLFIGRAAVTPLCGQDDYRAVQNANDADPEEFTSEQDENSSEPARVNAYFHEQGEFAGSDVGIEGVESGRQALLKSGELPWYNAQADTLDPVELLPQPPLRRSSDWEWRAKPASANKTGKTTGVSGWNVLWTGLQWLVWIGLIAIFITFAYLWISAIAERQRLDRQIEEDQSRMRREADLIEQLPFQVKRPTQDLVSEARHAYQTGDYRSAIVYLFSYQLVQLDRHQRIHLSKGKTNRQYLFELGTDDRLRQLLTKTIIVFEDVYFGHYDLDRERFESCWNRLREFETLLQQSDTARTAALTVAIALGLVLSGCQRSTELDTRYGRARGTGAQSINGLSVFAGMFEQAGFQVTTWRRLSPKLEREQVLVWAPDRLGPPRSDEIGFLNQWLDEAGRTLVFIGRDYNASADYWRDVLPRAAADQRLEIRNEIARAEAAQSRQRDEQVGDLSCSWFEVEAANESSPPHRLSGPWGEYVDARETRFSVNRRWKLPETDEDSEWAGGLESTTLLTADERLVLGRITRPTWVESQILIVPNGSWLLNARLINHEHRRLAQRVIDACGTPDRVCFLESDDRGLQVSDRDSNPPLMLQVFTVYPANILMLHVVFLGILYCFSVYPIFGRPRTLPADAVSDFGKHVTAVGEMFEKGRDQNYARSLLEQYRDKT